MLIYSSSDEGSWIEIGTDKKICSSYYFWAIYKFCGLEWSFTSSILIEGKSSSYCWEPKEFLSIAWAKIGSPDFDSSIIFCLCSGALISSNNFGIVHIYIVPEDSANYQEFWAIRRYFMSEVTSNLRVQEVWIESV